MNALAIKTAVVVHAALTDLPIVNTILDLLSQGAMLGGGIFMLFQAIGLGASIKEHNGQGIQSNSMGLAGGAIILAAAAMFKTAFIGW